MSPTINPAFRTLEAAAYCTERGAAESRSHFEKLRMRGPEDPRDRGPDFYRDERGICWYTREALDAYIQRRLALRQFRAPAPQPDNFRKPLKRNRRGAGA